MPGNPQFDYGNTDDPELEKEILDPVQNLVRKMLREKEKANHDLERKLQKIVNQRNPTGSSIRTRRGLVGKNKTDLATVDTEKGNDDLAVLIAKAIRNACKIATYGHEIATSAADYMYTQDDELPDELHGYGRALSKVLSEILAEQVVEGTTMYSELTNKRNAKLHSE